MQLLSIGWIGQQGQTDIPGNYLQYSVETYIGKESEKNRCLYVYIQINQFAEPETKIALSIKYSPI